MDLRRPVLGILVGGAPAPGVNGVISAAAIEAINSGCIVHGFIGGYSCLKRGQSMSTQIEIADIAPMHSKGGSYLRTSKEQLTNDTEVDNALRVMEMHRVRYLLTIGGTVTAYSTYLLSKLAKDRNYNLSVVHVPKTIFSDLPLPQDARTFGYSTAREIGAQVVANLYEDAKTMDRWYVVNMIGSEAGHLCLGIGKAAAATLTLIPEEFSEPVQLKDIVDHVDACVIKRETMNKGYGIVLLTEGLVDKMDSKEVEKLWGSVEEGHVQLARTVTNEVIARIKAREKPVPRMVPRDIGFELRGANPNAADRELSRDLGYGAAHDLLRGGSGHMVTVQGANLISIAFEDLLDPKTGKTAVKRVDVNSLGFEVAKKYMIRLRKTDLEDRTVLQELCKAAGGITPDEFKAKFSHIAL